jgi:hypothetical protein
MMQNPPPQNADSPVGGPDNDPLLSLYKMSATAGAGSQEYIEINVLAVVALLFGLASIFALMDNVLLAIPLTGIVLGFVATRQIMNSNGTQSGRIMAYLGILLSLGIGGGSIIWQMVDAAQKREDTNAIAATCQKFGDFMRDHKYDDAYNLFDDYFQQRVGRLPFKAKLMEYEEQAGNNPITGLEWNQIPPVIQSSDQGKSAKLEMIVHYKQLLQGRLQGTMRTFGNEWKFDDIPSMFPQLKGDLAAQGAAQSPPPAGQ